MADNARAGQFSPQRLLTPRDYQTFLKLREASLPLPKALMVLSGKVGWRYLWRVLLRATGGALMGLIHWGGRRIQAARFPLSPFFWLQYVWRFAYKLRHRARPLSEAQVARLREAAEGLHPEARPRVLSIKTFQARLPRNWRGQYTPFGDIALYADQDEPDPNLIRHEWAHYWWSHQMTGEERAAFVKAAKRLAANLDVSGELLYAQEIARAVLQHRDALCEVDGRKWRIPLQSNDGYRVAYCFGLIDLEIHAYIVQFSGGDPNRIPDTLRPFFAGFLPD